MGIADIRFIAGFIIGNIIVVLLLWAIIRAGNWAGNRWDNYLHENELDSIRKHEAQRKRIAEANRLIQWRMAQLPEQEETPCRR